MSEKVTYTEEEFREEFGRRLTQILKKNKITQEELVYRSGLSFQNVKNCVKGRVVPSIRSIVNLHYAIGCSYEELIGFCDFVE